MPRQKKSSNKSTSGKKKLKVRESNIHPKLAHLAGACVGVEDGTETLAGSELAGITADRCLLYRVGPKSVTNGRRVFLHTFGYYPEITEIKELYGGGEFWVQVYSDGGYAGGSPRIAIEGEPKLVTESSPGKALDSLPSSSDPIVNVLMQTLMQFMDRMVEEIKELKATSPVASGLNPEKVRELMNAATEAQLTNRLVLMATGGNQASPVDADAVADRRLKAMLDMFKMGIDAAKDGGDGDSDGFGGLVSRFAPLLDKLLASSAMNTAMKPVVPPGQATVDAVPAAPVIDVSEASDPAAIERDRENFEGQTQEYKTQMLVKRLQNGIVAMLDALESNNEYDDGQICDFIVAAVPAEELVLVRTSLTFDKVRLLVQSNPQDQIALDSNQARVEMVLAELVSRL